MFDPPHMQFQQNLQGMVRVEPVARIRCDVDLVTYQLERRERTLVDYPRGVRRENCK
jgi:hypothetical protein